MEGIGRVALDVHELEHCANFYEVVVGLERVAEGPDRIALGAGGEQLVVLRASDAPARRPDEAGLFHLALRVPDRAALADALYRSSGAIDGAADHGVSEALYLRDPEGNGVEIYRDRPRSAWPTARDDTLSMGTGRLDVDDLRGQGEDATHLPPESDVGHVHLEVTSLDAARSFYVDALGLRVRQEWPGGATFLAVDEYHHHVAANVWNERSTRHRGRGLAWFELAIPNADERIAASRRAGYTVTEGEAWHGVTDDDGLTVRILDAE